MKELAGIDREEALTRLMGNESLLMSVVNGMIKEFQNGREQMEFDIKKGSYDSLVRAAHRIKGVAANISAYAIYDALAELEVSAKNKNEKAAMEFFLQAEKAFDQLGACLEISYKGAA